MERKTFSFHNGEVTVFLLLDAAKGISEEFAFVSTMGKSLFFLLLVASNRISEVWCSCRLPVAIIAQRGGGTL